MDNMRPTNNQNESAGYNTNMRLTNNQNESASDSANITASTSSNGLNLETPRHTSESEKNVSVAAKPLSQRTTLSMVYISAEEMKKLILAQDFSNDVSYRVDGNLVFSDCSNLQAFPINSHIKGNLTIKNCENIETLFTHYNQLNFSRYSKLCIKGDCYIQSCRLLNSIPDNIEVGGNIFFEDCTSLISLPSSITSLGSRSYGNTCIEVGGHISFKGCTSLTRLPNGITRLGLASDGVIRQVNLINTGLSNNIINQLRTITPPPEGMLFTLPLVTTQMQQNFANFEEAFTFWAELANYNTGIPELDLNHNQAMNLIIFLNRLTSTADYSNHTSRPLLAQRVIKLIELLSSAEKKLIEDIITIIYGALDSCDDRVILGLENIEIFESLIHAKIIAIENSDPNELRDLGLQMMRLGEVKRIAYKKMETFRWVDQVELELAFLIGVGKKLKLPGSTQHMIFRGVSEVSNNDIAKAINLISKKCNESTLDTFLATWDPWQQYQRKHHILSFDELESKQVKEFDDCAITATETTEMVAVNGVHIDYNALCKWYIETGRNPITNETLDWSKVIRLSKKVLNKNDYLVDNATAAGIALVTQAMEQATDAEAVFDFLTDTMVKTMIDKLPLLEEQLNNILNTKLLDKSFKRQLIDEVQKHCDKLTITNNTLSFSEILLNTYIATDILTIMITKNINVNELINLIDIQYINTITAEVLATLSKTTIELLVQKATNSNNHEIAILCMKHILVNNKEFTSEEIFKKIQAKNKEGSPLLYIALNSGLDEIVAEYTNLILNTSALKVEQKIELIQSKDANGFPRLCMALYKGSQQTVAGYIKFILATNIFDQKQKLEIIKAKASNGCPGLYLALQNGNQQTVVEYIKLILATRAFDETQKLEIIQAKDFSGVPGLFIALQQSHQQTVVEYIKLILATEEFDEKEKLEIIQAKKHNGTLGLYVALLKEDRQTATEYIKLILDTNIFKQKQKLEIIQAKKSNGDPGLYVALCHGQQQTTVEYINIILNTDKLKTEQKLKIIQANSHSGIPGLHVALELGYTQTAVEYIKIILNTNTFDTKQKLKLIQVKTTYGFSGLYLKFYPGNEQPVREYINTILNSEALTVAQKKMLFIKMDAISYRGYSELINNSSSLTMEEKQILLQTNAMCTIS